MIRTSPVALVVATVALAVSVDATCVPEFGMGATVISILGEGSGLHTPRDLQFHPQLPDELWVASAAPEDRQMSGNMIIRKPGTKQQTTQLLRDRVAYHYMDNVAAFAFDHTGEKLFTCQESDNSYLGLPIGPNYFQGPTAFEVKPCSGGYGKTDENGRCEVLTVSHNGPLSTNSEDSFLIHSDMLHEAPWCMGIAHDELAVTGSDGLGSRQRTPGNIVWQLDGQRGKLMRFDFDSLHTTMEIDHRFANIRRYVDVDIQHMPGVPGHMIVDSANRHLYICDPSAGRVLRVNADSGRFLRSAMCVDHECYADNTNATCSTNGVSHATMNDCNQVCSERCELDLYAKYNCVAGWCNAGVCAKKDNFGCYTTFTETGTMFEYELWGCTEFEEFTKAISKPSGIAMDTAGRLFISDFDTGVIHAFDRAGNALAQFHTGKTGVTGLEVKQREEGSVLYFVSTTSKEVLYLEVNQACSSAGSLAAPTAVIPMTTQYQETCSVTADKTRPDFGMLHATNHDYEARMIVHHAYGKVIPGVEVGATPQGPDGQSVSEPSVAGYPDREDCKAMNYDLLVMAGFFCHPCLPNPCFNGGTCTNIVRSGYICECPSGYSGHSCDVPSTQCSALPETGNGVFVPATCSSSSSPTGTSCTKLCKHKNMHLVPSSTGLVSTARICGADGVWGGSESYCACVPRYFGEDCSVYVEPIAVASATVGAAGGTISNAQGDGITIPANMLTSNVPVSVETLPVSSISNSLPMGRVAVSDVKEFGIAGIPASVTLTYTLALLTSSRRSSSHDSVRAFYWDPAANTWKGVGDVQSPTQDKITVQAPPHSRWVVLSEDGSSGGSVIRWVGIGIGIAAAVLIPAAAAWYFFAMRKQSSLTDGKGSPVGSRDGKHSHGATGEGAVHAVPAEEGNDHPVAISATTNVDHAV